MFYTVHKTISRIGRRPAMSIIYLSFQIKLKMVMNDSESFSVLLGYCLPKVGSPVS